MTDLAKIIYEAAARAPDEAGIQVRGLNSDTLERLRNAVTDYGGPSKLASALGIRASSMSDTLSGRTEPRASLVAAISHLTGHSLDWIMFGRGSARPGVHEEMPAAPTDVLSLPFYDVRASAGPGATPLEEEPTEVFGIDRRFAQAVGITASDIIALPVEGDSGQPILFEGDTILVDRSRQELRDGMLYVIGVDSDVVVKRVHRQMDRSVILRSDNPAYEPQHIGAADVERLRVIGRVRWAIRGM